MGIIGTGAAAGVAQTAHQAQQVAKVRDKQEIERAEQLRRLRQLQQARLRDAEDNDSAELRVETDMPLHDHANEPATAQDERERKREDGLEDATVVEPGEAGQADVPLQIYTAAGKPEPSRRLDVEG